MQSSNEFGFLKRLLPGWPVVPPQLWLTGAGAAAVALSLFFEHELWPNTPNAGRWTWALLQVLLVAGCWQTGAVVWRWSVAYIGPVWLGLLWRALALSVVAVLSVVGLGLLGGLLYVIAR